MFETLQIVQLIINICVAAFGLLMAFLKPFRNLVLGKRKEEARRREEEDRKRQQLEEQRETDKCLLRDRILSIYYHRKEEKEIRQYEFENLSNLYAQYKKLGGNSFVDKVWVEIKTWEVTD